MPTVPDENKMERQSVQGQFFTQAIEILMGKKGYKQGKEQNT